MAAISQLEVNGTTYDLCDAVARDNYLPLTAGGDKQITGPLWLTGYPAYKKSSLIDITTPDSSPRYACYTYHLDKNDNVIGYIRSIQASTSLNGRLQMQIVAGNGTIGTNSLGIGVETDGSPFFTFPTNDSKYAFIDALGTRSTVNAAQSNNGVSADVWHPAAKVLDSSGRRLTFVGSGIYSGGNVAACLFAYNFDSSGNQIGTNGLNIGVRKDGTHYYSLTDAQAFRDAIKCGHYYEDSSAGYGVITDNKASRVVYTGSNIRKDVSSDSGATWTVERYVPWMSTAPTGSAQQTANQVLATPNGSNGLPSYRALVPADVWNIGTIISTDISTAVNVTSGTSTSIGSITLTKGTWVIAYGGDFAGNATGNRSFCLGNSTTAPTSNSSWDRLTNVQTPNCGASNKVYLKGSYILTTSGATIYLFAWQNSGSTLATHGTIRAIKII